MDSRSAWTAESNPPDFRTEQVRAFGFSPGTAKQGKNPEAPVPPPPSILGDRAPQENFTREQKSAAPLLVLGAFQKADCARRPGAYPNRTSSQAGLSRAPST